MDAQSGSVLFLFSLLISVITNDCVLSPSPPRQAITCPFLRHCLKSILVSSFSSYLLFSFDSGLLAYIGGLGVFIQQVRKRNRVYCTTEEIASLSERNNEAHAEICVLSTTFVFFFS
jgi:hypothetical protein